MEGLFVIKTTYGCFVSENSNKKEMNMCGWSINGDLVKSYSFKQLKKLYHKYKEQWEENQWKVLRVTNLEVSLPNWYFLDKPEIEQFETPLSK